MPYKAYIELHVNKRCRKSSAIFLGVEKLKRLSLYTCIQGSKTWMIIRIRNVQNYFAEVLLNSFSTVCFLQLSS